MTPVAPKIDLTEPTLFGNDAAEDEEEQEVFDSYFFQRPEVDDFLSPSHKLRILRAYRGEGKSAILRKAFSSLLAQANDSIVTRAKAASLAPDLSTPDYDQWTKKWKHAIFTLLACEIGSRIGMAWTDDAMSLVEEAEKNGFKSRSLVSGVMDRMKKSPVPLERQVIGVNNPEKVVQRWMDKQSSLWVFIDDIDENFQNTPESRAKIVSFFTACRHIVSLVPEIRIRTGIRPNVWTILRADAESLSKVEQYVIDMRWETAQMRAVLARRVEGYLQRSGQTTVLRSICNDRGVTKDEKLIGMVFQSDMPWGFNVGRFKQEFRQPYVVLSTLAWYRPRWMIQMAKAAAQKARQGGSPLILVNHLSQQLSAFGQQRIMELSAEYSSLCPQVREIINAFFGQPEDFTTAALHETIKRRVLPGLNITIAGVGAATTTSQVAAMLYEIGFLTARENLDDGGYKHHTFAEKPDLLHSRTNIDQGMSWEIHPVFRQVLGMRDADGQKVRRQGGSSSR